MKNIIEKKLSTCSNQIKRLSHTKKRELNEKIIAMTFS